MPKKSPRLQGKEKRLVAWYKWEFLRRNLEYRQNYEVFVEEFGDWFGEHGYWYDETVTWNREEREFFAKMIAPKVKAICQRWQIREPLPPSWSGKHCYSRPGMLAPTECSKQEAGQGWESPDFLLLSAAELSKRIPESTAFRYGPKPDYQLELELDLRCPLDFLLRQAEDQIKSRKRKFDRKHARATKIAPAFRRRLDVYDTYLKVWDLRKRGEKYDFIGAFLFPGEPLVAASQRAQDSHARAQELIDGGYKELR
jgi:hypothetical protein